MPCLQLENAVLSCCVCCHRNRDYLEDKLRSVTMERESVRGLMMWCMEHSDSADEVWLTSYLTPISQRGCCVYVLFAFALRPRYYSYKTLGNKL